MVDSRLISSSLIGRRSIVASSVRQQKLHSRRQALPDHAIAMVVNQKIWSCWQDKLLKLMLIISRTSR